MTNYTSIASVFRALGDPTRIAVVEELSKGPASVTRLAENHDLALPTFLTHLEKLEDCGLIRSHKTGRVRTCELVTDRMENAEQWLARARTYWEDRLDNLASYLESEAPERGETNE